MFVYRYKVFLSVSFYLSLMGIYPTNGKKLPYLSSIYPSPSLFALFLSLSLSIYLSLSLSIYLSIFIYLYIYQSIYLSLYNLSVHLYIYPSINIYKSTIYCSIIFFVHLVIYQSISINLSLYFWICSQFYFTITLILQRMFQRKFSARTPRLYPSPGESSWMATTRISGTS